MNYRVERIGDGPIINPNMDKRMGTNINGPSLIRTPEWFPSIPGRYLLYFAHHNGTYIRLAFADRVEGPWHTHEPGVIDLENTGFIDHIASPEVLVDDEAREIRLYFHGRTGCKPDGSQIQGTRVGVSSNGLNFAVRETLLGPAYFRVLRNNDAFYAFARGGELLKSPDGFAAFESRGVPAGLPANIRHVALWQRSEKHMTLFHTVIGEAPEVVYGCKFIMDGDWRKWRAEASEEVLRPEFPYEGADFPPTPSERGAIDVPANQLRDPDIFIDEDGTVFMTYSVAGEAGIALARVATA